MPRKEKSFFGKIMGGSLTDEDDTKISVSQGFEEDSEDEEPEIYDETDELEEEVDEEEETEESEPVIPSYQQPEQSEVAVKNNSEQEWMSDFEGQLNIDMFQTKDNVIIKSTIAGVRPGDIDITVANDMVTVKGTRTKEESISQEDYFYQECYWGGFTRSVIVPVDIDSEHIEADLKDGILTIIIPKAAKAKTRKVKVKGL